MGGAETLTEAAQTGLNTWCAISTAALEHNVGQLRRPLSEDCLLGAVVKSNAYGHDMLLCARRFLAAGADWLVVNALYEARRLRDDHVGAPIYVCGPVAPGQADLAVATGARVALYDAEVALALDRSARAAGCVAPVHIKLETGMHRQGLEVGEALELARRVAALPGLQLEGLTSHLADTDEIGEGSSAQAQLRRFEQGVQAFRAAGHDVPIVHIASSGAVARMPRVTGALVRTGIAAYGLWPSPLVRAGAAATVDLRPVLSWHCRVAQVKVAQV